MRGFAFSALERTVIERFGEDCFEAVLAAVAHRLETTEPFVGVCVYPDEDFLLLLDEVVRQTGVDRDTFARAVGWNGFDLLATRHREIVAGHRDLRGLFATLERGWLTAPELTLSRDGQSFRAELHAPAELAVVAEGLLIAAAMHFHDAHGTRRIPHDEASGATCAWEVLVP